VWIPLIESAKTGVYWAAITEIVECLYACDYPSAGQYAVPYRMYEEALLYAYYGICTSQEVWLDRATETLNGSILSASALRANIGLFGGIAGLGWTVEHISCLLQRGFEERSEEAWGEEEEDLNSEVDQVLLSTVSGEERWSGPYDLIGGLVGIGVYFLERLPRRSGVEGVKKVITRLEQLSEVSDQGIAWHTRCDLLPPWQRDLQPLGHYNIGIAHGIPGIMAFLGEAYAAGVEPDLVRQLLEGAVKWLLIHQNPPKLRSRFPSWIVSSESADSRIAWCYGDLGIAAVLSRLSRQLKRADWAREAQKILDHCLKRPCGAEVVDMALCHGAIGVAHIYNRLHQADGDDRYAETARAWFSYALTIRKPAAPIGGVQRLHRTDPRAVPVWDCCPTLLDGAIGVALALIAAVTPVAPTWDRLLLLSGRSGSPKVFGRTYSSSLDRAEGP